MEAYPIKVLLYNINVYQKKSSPLRGLDNLSTNFTRLDQNKDTKNIYIRYTKLEGHIFAPQRFRGIGIYNKFAQFSVVLGGLNLKRNKTEIQTKLNLYTRRDHKSFCCHNSFTRFPLKPRKTRRQTHALLAKHPYHLAYKTK